MEPEILWISVAPGVMELPTTKFRITYKSETGSFYLTWNDEGTRSYRDLQSAKEGSNSWMADLIEMGLEV